MELSYSILFVSMLLILQVECVPVEQFFQTTGHTDLVLGSDSTTIPPYTILGRRCISLEVQANGVITLEDSVKGRTRIVPLVWMNLEHNETTRYNQQDLSDDNNITARVSQLIQQNFGYSFTPHQVVIITQARSLRLPNDAFQFVLATNGQDTFMFLLYADGPSNDLSSRSSGPTGTNSWPGIYGRDGTSNYTIPYPQIIYASNVNEPGFWIFKLDSHIIGGPPLRPTNLTVTSVRTKGFTSMWTQNTICDTPESFRMTCQPVNLTSHFADVTSFINSSSSNFQEKTHYEHTITGLEEYTKYACSIAARNIFGEGPPAEAVIVMTNSSGMSDILDAPSGSSITISTPDTVVATILPAAAILLLLCMCIRKCRRSRHQTGSDAIMRPEVTEDTVTQPQSQLEISIHPEEEIKNTLYRDASLKRNPNRNQFTDNPRQDMPSLATTEEPSPVPPRTWIATNKKLPPLPPPLQPPVPPRTWIATNKKLPPLPPPLQPPVPPRTWITRNKELPLLPPPLQPPVPPQKKKLPPLPPPSQPQDEITPIARQGRNQPKQERSYKLLRDAITGTRSVNTEWAREEHQGVRDMIYEPVMCTATMSDTHENEDERPTQSLGKIYRRHEKLLTSTFHYGSREHTGGRSTRINKTVHGHW